MPLERRITKIEYSSRFLRSFGKLPADMQDRVRERERMFRENVFDSRLDTHKLHGRRSGEWSYTVGYDYRVIFVFRGGNETVYLDVGTHDELYD